MSVNDWACSALYFYNEKTTTTTTYFDIKSGALSILWMWGQSIMRCWGNWKDSWSSGRFTSRAPGILLHLLHLTVFTTQSVHRVYCPQHWLFLTLLLWPAIIILPFPPWPPLYSSRQLQTCLLSEFKSGCSKSTNLLNLYFRIVCITWMIIVCFLPQ